MLELEKLQNQITCQKGDLAKCWDLQQTFRQQYISLSRCFWSDIGGYLQKTLGDNARARAVVVYQLLQETYPEPSLEIALVQEGLSGCCLYHSSQGVLCQVKRRVDFLAWGKLGFVLRELDDLSSLWRWGKPIEDLPEALVEICSNPDLYFSNSGGSLPDELPGEAHLIFRLV